MDSSRFPGLDPELVGLVELLPDMTRSMEDIEGARALIAGLLPEGPAPGEELLDIIDTVAPGEVDVPVRVYRPRDATGDRPGLLYLHGGGFCLGSVTLEHPAAVSLANALGIVVVSAEYRLAPEHPYPAGLEDCHTGLRFLAALDGVDPGRLAVHGQSAGGGLAAATALLARDRGGPALCFQSLGIPELDHRLDTPSMRTFTDTPLWSRPQAELSWRHYLGGGEADGYASPAVMEDLTGLPPAYVTTCGLDPLRDEGNEYASRLMAAGVPVELHSFPGAFHGVALAQGTAIAARMEHELVTVLRRALSITASP